MTTFWSEWELEEEGKYDYLPIPEKTQDVKEVPLSVGPDGYAEIKPHNLSGIADGLEQLYRHPGKRPRILITYRPLKSGGGPATEGLPATVQVLATRFVRPKARPATWWAEAVALKERPGVWWNLGSFRPPKQVQIRLTLDDRRQFGLAIESYVRDLFCVEVLKVNKPPREMWTGTGGHRLGADVRWYELADLYAELGTELRDPLYAELAFMLGGSTQPPRHPIDQNCGRLTDQRRVDRPPRAVGRAAGAAPGR